MPTPTQGTLLDGRYRLVRKIARGGMGEVWQGHIEYPGGQRRNCAIKFTRPGLPAEVSAAQLMREALFGFEVTEDHPNLVTTRDYRDSPYGMFVVTQLVDGPTLWDVADQLMGEYARLCQITQSTLFALAELHDHGVVHRDVSPANILIDRTGTVKLIDFGLSTHVVSSHNGTARGVPAYMSPEELGMGTAVPESDLWSLGAVLYTLITDRPPYGSGSLREIHDRMKQPRAPLPDDVPAPLARIVDGLLVLDPFERMTVIDALDLLRDSNLPIASSDDIASIAKAWLDRGDRQGQEGSHSGTQPRPGQAAQQAARLQQATTDVGMGSLPGLSGAQPPPDMQTDRDHGTPPPAEAPDHAAYAETPMDQGDAAAVPDMAAGAIPVPMDILASNGRPTADELLQRWLASRNAPPPLIESREPPPALPAMHPPPEPRPSDDRRPLPNGWPAWAIIAALTFVIGILLARPGELVIVQAPEPEARISLPATPEPEPEARVSPPATPALEREARVSPPATPAPDQPSMPEPETATTPTTSELSEPAETSAPPIAAMDPPPDTQRKPPPSREQRPERPMHSAARVSTRPEPPTSEDFATRSPGTHEALLASRVPLEQKMWMLGMVARGAHEKVINRGKCSDAGICVVAERIVQFDDGQWILRVRVHNGSDRDFRPATVALAARNTGTNLAELTRWTSVPDGMETNVIAQDRTATGAVWLHDSARVTGEHLELIVSESGSSGKPGDTRNNEGSRRVAVAGIQLR